MYIYYGHCINSISKEIHKNSALNFFFFAIERRKTVIIIGSSKKILAYINVTHKIGRKQILWKT